MSFNVINNKNKIIIEEFEKLVRQIKVEIDISPSTSVYSQNLFRLKQISNSLDIIKNHKEEIKSGNDLKDIKGIGKGTINRIDEILKTGKLKEIKIGQQYGDKKSSEYVQELLQIHGIGQTKAYELVTKYGIKSIDELKKAHRNGIIELNNIILTGLKYHGIYKENIPRKEIDQINIYLGEIAKSVDNKLFITICGSYRRLKDTSNDIDVLIAHPKIKTKNDLEKQQTDNYLLQLIRKLKNDKFILDDLTDKDYRIKYMGYCKYNDLPVRRIDLRYIPYESYHSATLYFTGGANFNKRMRSIAEHLGYLLNEYGLYKIDNQKKIRIKIESEADIFDKLGMEYLPPEKRN